MAFFDNFPDFVRPKVYPLIDKIEMPYYLTPYGKLNA
jgi:hypothetical protein